VSALAGKRILVTRPRDQAKVLCDRLEARGAIPIPFPTIEIAPLLDYAKLDLAIRHLADYDWVIFTSVNGVKAFWERLKAMGTDLGMGKKIAAIGPATAEAVRKHGASVAFMPNEYIAEAIAAGLGDVQEQRFLLPRAELARETLAIELKQRGAHVDEIAAYRTLPAVPDADSLKALQQGVGAITFTSSSTVRNFVAIEITKHLDYVPVIACLGPITAQTARDVGLAVTITAADYTLDGLITALENYYAEA
jgi:uroporphyrinogen-III synthase